MRLRRKCHDDPACDNLRFPAVTSGRSRSWSDGGDLRGQPVGAGLLRKKVGDKVAIKVPGGTLSLEILSVRFAED